MISWSRRLNWAICLIVSVDKIVGGTAVFKLLLNKLKLIDILTNNLKIKFRYYSMACAAVVYTSKKPQNYLLVFTIVTNL